MASINASTAGVGGVITTADNTGILNIQSGGTTVAAVTSSGVAVTGTLSASGIISSSAVNGFLTNNGVSTSGKYISITNTGGTAQIGVESSAGGTQIVGSSAYMTAIAGQAGIGFSGNNGTTLHATLNTSGNLLVGTTTASGKLAVSNNTNQTIAYLNADSGAYSADALYIQVATTSTNQYNFINCTRSGVAVKFLVKDTGNVQNANNSYGAISDIKLKENIVDTSPKLDKLLQVKIRNYNLKTEPDQKQIGVIAQELETIFPSLIEETEDKEKVTKTREVNGVEEEYTEDVLTGETTKAVKYSVFVPILIKAIQEQQAMIQELKAEIDLLKGAK